MTRDEEKIEERPCVRKHLVPSQFLGQCRLCWLATYCGQFQRRWGLPITAVDCDLRRLPKFPHTGRPDPPHPCKYRDEDVIEKEVVEANGLNARKTWVLCLHPDQKYGKPIVIDGKEMRATCWCIGCGPSCHGYPTIPVDTLES
jgi:hypothetical protein